MNEQEMVNEILKSLNFDAETFEETLNVSTDRIDEINILTDDICDAVFIGDKFNPKDVITTCLKHARTPGEMLLIASQISGKSMATLMMRRWNKQ